MRGARWRRMRRERGWRRTSLCRSEEHTSELQSRSDLVCRLLLEKKKKKEADQAYAAQPLPQLRKHLGTQRDPHISRNHPSVSPLARQRVIFVLHGCVLTWQNTEY